MFCKLFTFSCVDFFLKSTFLQVIPLRWLPYEAVYEDEYSTKSDVYAFGVLMWEVFAQGELPQSKINDNSFLIKLKEKKLEWKSHPSTPEPLVKVQVNINGFSHRFTTLTNSFNSINLFSGVLFGCRSEEQAIIF